jgi:hypothetical protein
MFEPWYDRPCAAGLGFPAPVVMSDPVNIEKKLESAELSIVISVENPECTPAGVDRTLSRSVYLFYGRRTYPGAKKNGDLEKRVTMWVDGKEQKQ